MTNTPAGAAGNAADSLVRKSPSGEGVGVDHHVEPPSSWLPEGAAPAVTEEATVASGQAETAGQPDSPNGAHAAEQQAAAGSDSPLPAASVPNGTQESLTQDADPVTYSHDGSYTYEQPGLYDYRQDTSYTTDYPAAQSGYNDGVSSSAGGGSAVPPLPAELQTQQTAQSATATKPVMPVAEEPPKLRPKIQAAQARRANLVIARLEPWSVMKFSFLMSLVAWVVLFVAVALLYYALSGLGVFGAIQRTLQSVTSSQSSSGVNLTTWTSASRVLGYTMLLGAVNIILITALSTIGAVIYNLVTHLGGGIEVTLKETD
jgi:Transmembrane domain of unknown function (DUF3566)